MPEVAHRCGLRACVAIGAGCREAVRGIAGIDPVRAGIVRLGAEAAARLAMIPDTPELQEGDRIFAAEHLAPDRARNPIVRQMSRLVARYRQECGIDAAITRLAIAEAYARSLARRAAAPNARSRPDLFQQKQDRRPR